MLAEAVVWGPSQFRVRDEYHFRNQTDAVKNVQLSCYRFEKRACLRLCLFLVQRRLYGFALDDENGFLDNSTGNTERAAALFVLDAKSHRSPHQKIREREDSRSNVMYQISFASRNSEV